MGKPWFIVFIFFVINLGGQSVINMVDEDLILEELNGNQGDTIRRVDVLNELTYRFQNDLTKRDTLWNWAIEAYYLAIQKKYLVGEGDALVRLGLLASKTGNFEKSVFFYKRALTIRGVELKKFIQAASVCNNLGLVYEKQKDSIPKAIDCYQNGLHLLDLEPESKAKKSSKAMLMNNLGDLFASIGNFDSAMLYLDSSLLIRQELDDASGMANTYYNLAGAYKRMGNEMQSKINYEESLALFQKLNKAQGIGKSLSGLGGYFNIVGDYEKSIEYYLDALKYSNVLEYKDLGIIYQDLAIAYQKLRRYPEAEKNYEIARDQFMHANDDNGLALFYFNFGSLFFDQNKYEEAIQNYKNSLANLGAITDVGTKVMIFNYLARAYSGIGVPDSALKYTDQFLSLKDSITQAQRTTINARYDLTVAEKKIDELNLEKGKEYQKKMKTFGIIGFGVSWLILGLVVMFYYLARQRRRLAEQNEKLSLQQLALSQQELIDVMRDKELETNYARLSGIETARKKLGQELHDNVGSMLSTVKMYFSSIDNKIETIQEENRQQYQKANELLDQACDEVRRLSHEMVSAILMKFGLKAQLETLAETLQNTGKLQVELATFGLKERLDNQTEINIYRMIQEMVNNVIKHAQASRISMQVNRFEEMINVMVEDNGIGFDVAKMEGGIGITNLKARVHELGGELNIDSTSGKGTTVSIDIPVPQEEPLTLKTN